MFKTSPSIGIEAIAEIIPIKFHLQKIARRSEICPLKLPLSYLLRSLMDDSPSLSITSNSHYVGLLTNRQRNLTKDHLINFFNKALRIFPSFSPLNPEFSPGLCIMDKFSNCFCFNLVNKKEKEKYKTHSQELDDIVLSNSSSPQSALVIMDASIKHDIATYHIQVHLSRNNVSAVKPPLNHTSPPFSQHISWRCCNHPGILSSKVEILLFNSVFHDGVTPISVSTLKPQAFPILSVVYKTSSYTVIC